MRWPLHKGFYLLQLGLIIINNYLPVARWFPTGGARPLGGGGRKRCVEKKIERNLHLAIFIEFYLPYIYPPVLITNFITL
jgi:hypothetical protein